MRDAVVVEAVRTPLGKKKGVVQNMRSDDMMSIVLAEVVKRSKADPNEIEDFVVGTAFPEGEQGLNMARMVIFLADLPVEIAGSTVNRFCASGFEAISVAAKEIQTDTGDITIGGGAENMIHIPMGGKTLDPNPLLLLRAGGMPMLMGQTAETVAERWGITREEQDEFSLKSHQKAIAAMNAGKFKEQIIPLEVKLPDGTKIVVDTDETPRADTSLEVLAQLKPAFKQEGGTVTAGNSSAINAGAAAVMLMEMEKAKSLGYTYGLRVVTTAVAGVDPAIMGIGPIPSTQKALKRAGLTVDDLDLIEMNEAFAAPSIACIRDLGIDESKLNINGGAIALGHPLGVSGARLTTMLFYEMKEREDAKYGLVTMCVGGGQGGAMIFERVTL